MGPCRAYSRRDELLEVWPGPGRPLDWAAVTTLLQRQRPAVNPRWLRGGTASTRSPWLAAHVAQQPEGNRDNALFWAACRAAENDAHDFDPLIAATVTAGLPERQAARTTYHPTRPAQTASRAAPSR